MMIRFFMRSIAYLWASPYTLTGILIGVILRANFQRVDGVIEINGPRIAKILRTLPTPAMAMTFGHVVFGVDQRALDVTRRHEAVHVKQYERWGPVFVPAYLIASIFMYIRGRDPYRDNPFEVQAYAVDTPDFSKHQQQRR